MGAAFSLAFAHGLNGDGFFNEGCQSDGKTR
jgi:hypothetical protein